MICLEHADNSLMVIQQDAHAAGCGELAGRWLKPSGIPDPIWPRFIQAVREHDAGWSQWERKPQLDTRGKPYSFIDLPNRDHIAVWKAGIHHQAEKDIYAALVVALHARWLFTHIADPCDEDIAASQQFIAEMDDFVDCSLDKLTASGDIAERQAIEPSNLTIVRRLLAFLDLLNLMLIGGLTWRQWGQRMQFGEHVESLWLVPENGHHDRSTGSVAIKPWPFEGESFVLNIPARTLGRRTFDDLRQFHEYLEASQPLTLQFEIRPG